MSAEGRLLGQVQVGADLAVHHLEQAEAKTREAGLLRKAGTLDRLSREATTQLGELPAESSY